MKRLLFLPLLFLPLLVLSCDEPVPTEPVPDEAAATPLLSSHVPIGCSWDPWVKVRPQGDGWRFTGTDGDDYVNCSAASFDVTIAGGDGNDEFYGGDGDDQLVGGNGEDILNGGDGDDHLIGGNDDDELIGGDGDDRLNCGLGVDTYWAGGDPGDRVTGCENET